MDIFSIVGILVFVAIIAIIIYKIAKLFAKAAMVMVFCLIIGLILLFAAKGCLMG